MWSVELRKQQGYGDKRKWDTQLRSYKKLREMLVALTNEEIRKCKPNEYFKLSEKGNPSKKLNEYDDILFFDKDKYEVCPVCPIAFAVVKAGFKPKVMSSVNKLDNRYISPNAIDDFNFDRVAHTMHITNNVMTTFASAFDTGISSGWSKQKSFERAIRELDNKYGEVEDTIEEKMKTHTKPPTKSKVK